MAKQPKPPSTSDSAKKNAENATGAVKRGTARHLTALEEKIVKLLQEHAKCAAAIGEQRPKDVDKRLNQLIGSTRIAQLSKKHTGPLDAGALGAIVRELVSAERALLETKRVAYLGPAHSYSHLATLQYFGRGVELIPVGSIATVFEEVADGQVTHGVVPIENSTDGRIVDTLDMFTKTSVKICGDIPFPIHHNLLGKGPRDGVKEICSKPQAISQCREWLSKHMPSAKLISMSSTTAAAEKAADDPKVAAIASYQAGVQYGLKVLAKNIEDNKNNVTRFAVIGSEPAAKSGNDKTSLMFELKHEPGALASAMNIFKNRKLNLTWIESFPKPGSPSEYLFFIELVGHQSEVRVKRALALLEKKSVRLEILGSCPIAP